MPELKLFNRRWHAATDTLPVLTALLCLFHVLWFVPYLTGQWSIESTGIKFDCSQGTLLRVASYSLFALFGAAALNELALTVLGLRGGPFETRKRRFMNPLLYLEVVLWFLLLCFTIYATVVITSDKVSSSCWSNNPCAYNAVELPLACRDKNGNAANQLSPACQTILSGGVEFMDVCWTNWLANGVNWIVHERRIIVQIWQDEYGAQLQANVSEADAEAAADALAYQYLFEESLNVTKLYCNATIDSSYWFDEIGVEIDLNASDEGEGQIAGFQNVQDYNAFLELHPNMFAYMNTEVLSAIANATSIDFLAEGGNLTLSTDMPWFGCLSPTCQDQCIAADECEQWAQLLALPNPSDRKRFFQILVITSWAVLGVTGLVLFMCFNAFPDYDDVDSWEGTVKSMGRMLCCGGAFSGSAAVGGSDMSVSHEIAKSLNSLFGGIDLDPTDRLLGIYLVSERQHRRRQQDVLSALQQAGYGIERHQSFVQRAVELINPKGLLSKGFGSRTLSGPAANGSARIPAGHPAGGGGGGGSSSLASDPSPPGSSGRSAAAAGAEDGTEAPQAVPLSAPAPAGLGHTAPTKLPQSPFDLAGSGGPSSATGRSLAPPGKSNMMMYQHSMLRLRSSVGDGRGGKLDLATLEEGRAAGDAEPGAEVRGGSMAERGALAAAAAAAEPEVTLEAPQGGSGASSSCQGISSGRVPSAVQELPGGSWQNTAIRVATRYHPLLTPSGCAGGTRVLDPPLSPQAAADIYAGKLEAVDFGVLKEAQRVSRFAVASYGLQSVIWAKGQRPGMCLANANRLVKCFKKPFALESKFKKQNFDTIVEMTGVDPSDLLYYSYTNVAGGVLPYIIMLHRPSKSVVLSVRGTVSMEDLVTDLLSNPVDVADWVPEWVTQEAARRVAAGEAGDDSGTSLKAHIGIVSSATAILKDMEDRGLLKELLLSKLLRSATLAGRKSQEVVAEYLASYQSMIPPLPAAEQGMKRNGGLGGDPLAAAEAGQGLAEAMSMRWGASAAAAAVAAAGGEQGEAAANGEAAAQFRASEQRHLQKIRSTKGEKEVVLPLERAQAIIRAKLQLQGWKVVVTGHSLGAAVACMLGMQLRDRFSDLECWAFNPPGGLLSWELSQIAQSYCTSIVVGKDAISRLSFNTSKRVVDEMVVALARCTRPKLKILFDMALGRRKAAETTPPTFCAFEQVGPEALALVERYYRASKLHMQTADTTEMYPPGKLVFMRPFKGKQKQQTVWDAVWIDAATLISEGILITPSMMAHHRLFVLADAFKSIFSGEAATEAAAQHEQGEQDLLEPLDIMP